MLTGQTKLFCPLIAPEFNVVPISHIYYWALLEEGP